MKDRLFPIIGDAAKGVKITKIVCQPLGADIILSVCQLAYDAHFPTGQCETFSTPATSTLKRDVT